MAVPTRPAATEYDSIGRRIDVSTAHPPSSRSGMARSSTPSLCLNDTGALLLPHLHIPEREIVVCRLRQVDVALRRPDDDLLVQGDGGQVALQDYGRLADHGVADRVIGFLPDLLDKLVE